MNSKVNAGEGGALRFVIGTVISTVLMGLTMTGCFNADSLRQVRATNMAEDMAFVERHQANLVTPLTLDTAISIALEKNLNVWVATMEEKVRRELTTSATLKTLPMIGMENGEYSWRNRHDSSSSVDQETKQQSLSSSFSRDRRAHFYDISAVWNILDFGMTFLQSRKSKTRAMIAGQELMRLRQTLVLDVTTNYYRALAARECARRSEAIQKRLAKMLANTKKRMKDGIVSPVDGLKATTPLLEQRMVLRRYQQDFRSAKNELGRLLGLTPDSHFTLAEYDFSKVPESVNYDPKALGQTALTERPELFVQDLEERISYDDARIALVKIFPSPTLFMRYEQDQDKQLYYDSWHSAGVRVAWDLFSIPSKFYERRASLKHAELVQKRRMALAVAILTQVNLTTIEHQYAQERLSMNREISDQRMALVKAMQAKAKEGKEAGNDADIMGEEIKAIIAYARYLMAYQTLLVARARVVSATGVVPEASATAKPTTFRLITREDLATAAQSSPHKEEATSLEEAALPMEEAVPATEPKKDVAMVNLNLKECEF